MNNEDPSFLSVPFSVSSVFSVAQSPNRNAICVSRGMMRHLAVLVLLLTTLIGCAARTVTRGEDVEPRVGKTVTIEGTVEATAAIMPDKGQGNTFCLTIPPGQWVTPVRESTMYHGDTRIAFTSSTDAPQLKSGDRVGVTGRLARLKTPMQGDAAPQYELRDAKWEAVDSGD